MNGSIQVLSIDREHKGTKRDRWYIMFRTGRDSDTKIRHLNWSNRDFRFGFLIFCMASDASRNC